MKKIHPTLGVEIEVTPCPECGCEDIDRLEDHSSDCSVAREMKWEREQEMRADYENDNRNFNDGQELIDETPDYD